MAKGYINGAVIPKDIFNKAEEIMKNANLAHRMDGFRIMGAIQPTILKVEKIRMPKSKETMLQIDVRHLFKL